MVINKKNKRHENRKTIWIDIINPSHPLFFRCLIPDLEKSHETVISIRKRGETAELAKQFGISGKIIGSDYEHPLKKTAAIFWRTIYLYFKIPKFDFALSFENPMSVAVSTLRQTPSILLLDNDLKYIKQTSFTQNLESKLKSNASHIIIPKACEQSFSPHFPKDKIHTYNGYKEDFYLADYNPDTSVPQLLPFKEYVVLRPEALYSFYVDGTTSLVDLLIESFTKQGINIVYLPRDQSDKKRIKNSHVFIPSTPINGLDLIYYSNAVLTGSGTMAREAAVMEKPAVSFFPEKTLLSVDQQLIKEKKLMHSRDEKEIIDYVISHYKNTKRSTITYERSKKVKQDILQTIHKIIK